MEIYTYEDYGDWAGFTGPGVSQVAVCAHNKKTLELPNGAHLRGFSGPEHYNQLEKLTGINIFLDSMRVPSMLYANWRAGVPEEMPSYKIVYYRIEDRKVPVAKGEFALLLRLCQDELSTKDGQINVSCIGGHGRTGLVLSVLWGLITGSKEPIKDIRAMYCKKAVESYQQECFVHEWLGLERPLEVVEMCKKCSKRPQFLRADGSRDLWCFECDAEWQKEQEERKNKPMPTVVTGFVPAKPMVTSGIQKNKCTKCMVRDAQVENLFCLTCSFDATTNDIPMKKPVGWTKNAWKRFLRAFTGSAHNTGTKATSHIDNQKLVKSLKENDEFAYLKEKPIHTMSDTEWRQFLKTEFGRE